MTERGITTADDATDSALADWTQQALNTAAVARNQYLVLVKARESLTTQQASLALAREVQSQNEARVTAGVLASYQLQESRLGVLQAQKNLLDAERAEKDAHDQLRTTLHLPAGTSIETTQPPPPGTSGSVGIRCAAYRNASTPRHREGARRRPHRGIQREGVPQPRPSLPRPAGKQRESRDSIPSYGDAFGDMGSAKYPNWSVGLSFSVPIGNSSARADVAASRLIASQARTQLAATEESAALEVQTALRALISAQEQIGVTEQGVTAAEALMDSYLKRQKLGLATTKDVLDVSASLTQARQNYSAARADYQIGVHEPVEGHRGAARPPGDPTEGKDDRIQGTEGNSMKKIVIGIVLAAVVAFAGYMYFRKDNGVSQYRTAKVEKGEIVDAIAATGTINAVTTVSVGSQVSGTIQQIFVDFNSRVKQGAGDRPDRPPAPRGRGRTGARQRQ